MSRALTISQIQRRIDALEDGKRVSLSDDDIERLHSYWIKCLETTMGRRDISIGTYQTYRAEADRLKVLAKRHAAP